jgi:putative aminopeptidase FrvX
MIRAALEELMLIPGLSGHEARVAAAIAARLRAMGHAPAGDRLGNLSVTLPGAPGAPRVLIFTHMDQLGFVVRKVEESGLIRLERLGGVPERALLAQAVVLATERGDIPGVIGMKSHHATTPEEKSRVVPYMELHVDAGFASRAEAEAAGVRIGTPVTYAPRVLPLAGTRLAGTAIDDRAGCAVLLALAERLKGQGPTVTLVWSVQEEFNLRGVLPAAQAARPDIALQIDLILATDTPDMAHRGDVALGGGPAMSLYSFHGRGTLNGVIPHPALVRAFEATAAALGMPLQRSAHTGALTDLSYVQFLGDTGVACLDLGFPCRYTHSALEVVDTADLDALAALVVAALPRLIDLDLDRTPAGGP